MILVLNQVLGIKSFKLNFRNQYKIFTTDIHGHIIMEH